MKNKGFTLIELLAVIIILGILMIIAIPSVTRYISDSRKSSYIGTAKEIVSGARNFVNDGKLEMFDTDTTYYIDVNCIKTENGTQSPYGEFTKAYVVVTYDGKGYEYYWTSVDDAGQGIKNIVKVDNLVEDDIESDLKNEDIINNGGIDGRNKYAIINKENSCTKSNSSIVEKNVDSETGEIKDNIVYPEGKTRSNLTKGDYIEIKGEPFYVIDIDRTNDKIVLFAKYNLKVGHIYGNSPTAIYVGEIDTNDSDYGKQSSTVKGGISGEVRYGTIEFSKTNYWVNTVSHYPSYVYNDNCVIKKYVDAYANYLGPIVKEARLLNYGEAYRISGNNYGIPIDNTTYWIGSVQGTAYGYGMDHGSIRNYNYGSGIWYGVRPVIII